MLTKLRRPISILMGLAILALLNVLGVVAALDLAHPYWHMRATLTGAGIGLAVLLIVFWLVDNLRPLAFLLGYLMILALPVALITTFFAARSFINAEDYLYTASRIWFIGYHVSATLLVVVPALIVASYLADRE